MTGTPLVENRKMWKEIFKAHESVTTYPHEAVVVWFRRLRRRESARTIKRVLDIGCGVAADLAFFAEEGMHYMGIDVNDLLFGMIRRRCRAFRGKFKLMRFSPPDLPFEDSVFDAVIGIESLHLNPTKASMRTIINEVHRVLKDGGVFLFTAFDARHFLIEERMADFIGDHAFRVTDRYGDAKRRGMTYFYFPDEATIRRYFSRFSEVAVGRHVLDLGDGRKNSQYIIHGTK
jgi:SAM-dependent methyltransferase